MLLDSPNRRITGAYRWYPPVLQVEEGVTIFWHLSPLAFRQYSRTGRNAVLGE